MTKTVFLRSLLPALAGIPAEMDRAIKGLSNDHRRVAAGDLFLALPGLRHHGLEFLQQAQAAGAAAVLWEPPFDLCQSLSDPAIPVIPVAGLRYKLGLIAQRFYGFSLDSLALIGITGTNGKTSCAHYIAQALPTPCGLLGTLGNGIFGRLNASGLTTPDSLALWQCLADIHAAGARHAVMEISSHALQQQRIAGLEFAVTALTNLSRDHLDYHGDMQQYAAAKRRLFFDYPTCAAVLNLDDSFGQALAAELIGCDRMIGYSLQGPVGNDCVYASELLLRADGLSLRVRSPWGEGVLQARLLGRFNAANLLAALASLLALDMPFAEALQRLAASRGVAGRMECFGGGEKPLAVVDYAHTPDALEQVLLALREHRPARLHCVFGCGGDRDPGKRAQMGAIAERLADRVLVTNDNPRSESPEKIAAAILSGMQQPAQAVVELDRAAAIRQGLADAERGDIVLVAGKGHEDYQWIGEQRLVFSDRTAVRDCLEVMSC